MPELLSPVWELQFAATGNRPAFLRDEPFVIFLRVSWVSLAGCGAGEEEIARSRVLRVRAAARSNSVRASGGGLASWRRFGIRVKNGHKAVSKESGCGLSVGQVVHVESEPAKSANLLSYAEWCRSDQGWGDGVSLLGHGG